MNDFDKSAQARIDAAIAGEPWQGLPRQLSAGFTPLDDAEPDTDNHRNAPRPDPACLYGLVGEIAAAGSATTEANPFAVAAAALGYLGAAIGRGAYLPVGNTWHHCNLFTLQIGRSGEGRKGDAVSLIRRIERKVKELSPDHAPKIHAGGLSTREGLVFLIHDGYRDGKEEVPPVLDKRLWVAESEFVNVLHQGKRDGNTLSAALRDCWDGVSLKPATKSNQLWATDPHVGLHGAITPSELRATVTAKELSNGFFNRFLPFWAERSKLLPFPQATPQHEVDRLALRIIEVLQSCQAERWAEPDVLRIELAQDARALWESLYLGELNSRASGERVTAMVERRAPMLLRIAMIFAVTDLTTQIQAKHINAALAWIRYSTESVKFVFASAQEERETEEVNGMASKILQFIGSRGRVTRKAITVECFQGNEAKTRIDAALGELLTANPPRIVVTESRDKPGRPTRFYELGHELTELTNNEQPRGFQADSDCSRNHELTNYAAPGTGVNSLVSGGYEYKNSPQTRASIESSLVRLVRSPETENDSSQDSEEF